VFVGSLGRGATSERCRCAQTALPLARKSQAASAVRPAAPAALAEPEPAAEERQPAPPPGAPPPRLIPPTAAAWQAARELAAPRTPPPAQTPPRSPAPSGPGSQNPSPATSGGHFTLLPGYVSRPQPSPAKPAPPPQRTGALEGGFVRPFSAAAGTEAYSAWAAGGAGGATAWRPWARDQPACHAPPPAARAQEPAGPLGAAHGAAVGPVDQAAPGADAASRPAGVAMAGGAQAGAEAGAKPLRKRRKRAGRERESPGGDLLLLGGLRRILADTPTPTARPWDPFIPACQPAARNIAHLYWQAPRTCAGGG